MGLGGILGKPLASLGRAPWLRSHVQQAVSPSLSLSLHKARVLSFSTLGRLLDSTHLRLIIDQQWHGSLVPVAPPLRAARPPTRNVLPVTVKATIGPPPHVLVAPDPVEVTSIASLTK